LWIYKGLAMSRRALIGLWAAGTLGSLAACAPYTVEVPIPLSTQPQVALEAYEAIAVLPFLTYREFQLPDAHGEPSIDYGQEVTTFVRNQIQSHAERPVLTLDWVDLPASRETSGLPTLPAWETDSFILEWLDRHLRSDGLRDVARPVIIFGVLVVRQQYAFLNSVGAPASATLVLRSAALAPPPSTMPMVRQFGIGVRLFAVDWASRQVLYTDYVEAAMDLLDVFRMHRDIQVWDAERIRMVAFYTLLDQTVPLLLGNIVPLPILRERLLVRE
jgi:hypothetical protein